MVTFDREIEIINERTNRIGTISKLIEMNKKDLEALLVDNRFTFTPSLELQSHHLSFRFMSFRRLIQFSLAFLRSGFHEDSEYPELSCGKPASLAQPSAGSVRVPP